MDMTMPPTEDQLPIRILTGNLTGPMSTYADVIDLAMPQSKPRMTIRALYLPIAETLPRVMLIPTVITGVV